MWKLIVEEAIEPMARRLGTMVGTALVGMGANSDQVSQVVTGVGALAGIAVDLYFDRRRRKLDLAADPKGL
jgi:hypothetical protein